MVHRLQSRNIGYTNNLTSTLATNQATLNATEGATALNLNNVVEENKNIQHESKQNIAEEASNDSVLENVSIENANYLQNLENIFDEDSKQDDTPTFEVDSIELVTPELFSNDSENNSFNQDNEQELEMFKSVKAEKETATKEPEMFEESNMEENFEIPAFLRRQKN